MATSCIHQSSRVNPIRWRQWAWGVLPVLVFFGLWEGAARLQLIPGDRLLPPFSGVLQEGVHLIQNGVLFDHFVSSFLRVVIGLCAGSAAGVGLGIVMGTQDVLQKTFSPVISLLYPIPALGWLPLFMLWIGINELLPIAIIFICSFFPIYYNTLTGIREVNPQLLSVARTLGSSERWIVYRVILPLALPNIFTGLRLQAGMAWRVIVAAEMVAIPTGIGALMMRAESLVRVDVILVCLLLLSVMCLLFERFFILVEEQLTAGWK